MNVTSLLKHVTAIKYQLQITSLGDVELTCCTDLFKSCKTYIFFFNESTVIFILAHTASGLEAFNELMIRDIWDLGVLINNWLITSVTSVSDWQVYSFTYTDVNSPAGGSTGQATFSYTLVQPVTLSVLGDFSFGTGPTSFPKLGPSSQSTLSYSSTSQSWSSHDLIRSKLLSTNLLQQ